MNRCTLINKVLYIERSWTYLQLLFESLSSFMKLLNMVVVQNLEVMLGQALNYFCVEFCNFVQCIYL
jgi:hypothetical protein